MRLTVQTDYALRLLMHLAVQSPELTSISESADRYKISKNHLMKIAHILKHFGYVEPVRGRSGGLRLAVKAENINIGEVIRRMESSSALVACFPQGGGGCAISPACGLKSILADALEAFFATLDAYTLSDLVSPNRELLESLLVDAD